MLRRAAAAAHPLSMLDLVSSMLAVADPRNDDPIRPDGDRPGYDDVLAPLLGLDQPDTTVALRCVALLVDDETVRGRVEVELARRRHRPPRGLRRLEPVAVRRAVRITEPHGEVEDLVVGLRTGAGHDITLVAQVDLLGGALLADAFVAPATADEVVRRAEAEPGLRAVDVAPADARSCLAEALARTAMTVPRVETDTWPLCRHLVEWLLGLLPEGGTGYDEWAEPSEETTAEVVDAFLTSPEGDGLDGGAASIAELLVTFASGYAYGDPLRWSPRAVEYLLLDWVPRKVVADTDHLARYPDVLRAFVRHAAAERGVAPELRDQTLATIDAHEQQFRELVSQPRATGPLALLQQAGLELAADALDDPGGSDDLDLTDLFASWLDRVADGVGGHDVLVDLEVRPLPDESLDLTGVVADVHARTREVAALLDEVAVRLFDVETRTAARRLLADVARADPAALRRGRPGTAAAAVLWIVASSNDAFDGRGGGVSVGAMMSAFGLGGSPSQRAQALLRAVGVDPHGGAWQYDRLLGTLRYATADGRASVRATRDTLLDRLAGG